jgi:protein-S-isoprenylcysteine O-methyltransferase Ste14
VTVTFLWLCPVMIWNWAAFSLGATLYFYIGALFEERKLRAYIGTAYERYRARADLPPLFLHKIRMCPCSTSASPSWPAS